MNDIDNHEVLHIYNEILYTNTHFRASYEAISGSFQQKILVLIHKKENNSELLMFLNKMLDACKLTSEDYEIGMLEPSFEEITSLLREKNPQTVILFGMTIENNAFQLFKNLNKPFRFQEKKFLLSNSLQEISATPSLKSTLWVQGLKPLFGIV